MKRHMMMASAVALAFATSAIAQEAASPAEPAPTTDASTGPAATTAPDTGTNATDAAAGASTATTDSTAATSPATTSDMAATPPASDAASAAAAPTPAPADPTAAPDAQAATSMPAPADPTAAGTQTATGAAAPAAVDPAKAQAADQMIAQNWSKYDAGGKGQLTPLEFGTWVLAAQGNDMGQQIEKSRQSRQANLPSTKVLNATAAEFSKADANKDRAISQDELRTYLAG